MSKRDHGYHTQNPITGVEYEVWHEGEKTHVIGTTSKGEKFHQRFPGDGSRYGTDGKGNDRDVPSK